MDITYVKAVFGSLRKTRTQPVYRDDHDLILQLVGVKGLPVHFQAHFSNTEYGTAVVMMGSDGEVSIPNTLLATGLPIYCWILVEQGISGAVRYSVQIPVRQKARPDGTIPPEQADIISQAISALNDAGTSAQEAADSAAQNAEYIASVKSDLDDAIDRVGVLEEAKDSTLEAAGNAEAWAVGNRGGSTVPSTDPAYHNNAKYYAEQAAESARTLTIDDTLTQAGQAADAKETGDKITGLKEKISEYDYSALISSGYYNLLRGTLEEKTESNSYVSCLLRVLPGEVMHLTGSGANAARLWGTADISGKILRKANNATNATDLAITIQDGEAFFVFNATANSVYYPAALYSTVDRAVVLNNIRVDISNLHEPMLRVECSSLLESGYYPMSSSVIQPKIESDSYVCYKMPVETGFKFVLSGQGATSGRLWATTDGNLRIKRVAVASAAETGLEITIAEGEKYFIFNASSTNSSYVPYLALIFNRVVSIGNATTANMSIDSRVGELENKIAEYEIRNNLKTDGTINLPGVKCYKNGEESPSNYGLPGTRYVLNVGDYDKCRIFFRFKHTGYVDYSGTDATFSVASCGKNNALHFMEMVRGVSSYGGIVYRNAFFYPANVAAANSVLITPQYYKPLNGDPSIVIEYTGSSIDSSTTATMTVSSGVITFIVGDDVRTVSYSDSDTIQSLADAINALTDYKATIINSNGTCSDLLLMDGMSINFKASVTRSGITYYGVNAIVIPFKVDSSWHTCEMLVDRENQNAVVAYDGLTKRITFASGKPLNDGIITIGGGYAIASDIIVEDLEIYINSYGQAEIVNGKSSDADTGTSYQIISEHNPRLMLFEGHGILVGTEAEAQSAYQESGSNTSQEAMQTATERLSIVFRELSKRGYVPVTWESVVRWKKNGTPLPRRCYTIMFDDLRFDNYIDMAKRKPLSDFNIKAGLAVISENAVPTDSISANDITYTVGEAIDIINTNGWYMCSHTAQHIYLGNYLFKDIVDYLNASIVSADKHKIHSDIIVYPFGSVSGAVFSAVMLSDFALGIDIVQNRYNCRATADYRLGRTEIGTRSTLENVLSPFV